jgi:hypothetical protein
MKKILMKKVLMAVLATFFFVLPLYAGDNVLPNNYRPTDFEAITVADTAIGFTAAKLVPTVVGVFCTLETGQVRFRMDGTDPDATTGHLLEVGQSFTITNRSALANIKFIRTSSTSGALKATYLSE